MENSKTPIDIKTLIQTSTIEIYDKNTLYNSKIHANIIEILTYRLFLNLIH